MWYLILPVAAVVLYALAVVRRLGLVRRLTLAYSPISLDRIPDIAAIRLGETPLFTTDEPCTWSVPALARAADPLSWSAVRVRDTADHVAGLLRRIGMRDGDRVVILKRNHFDMHVLSSAIVRGGGIACPINSLMAGRDAARHIASIGARVIIIDTETLLRMAPDTCISGITDVVLAGRRHNGDDSAQSLVQIICPDAALHWIEEALGDGSLPHAASPRAAHDVCYIVHSSGTTGFPKPVMLTNGAQSHAVRGWLAYVHLSPLHDRGYVAVPNNHQAVMLTFHSCLLLGLRVHWTHANHISGFDAERVIRELADGGFTGYFGFPITYTQLKEVDLSRFDLRRMRFWATTADASHEVIQRQFAAVGGLFRSFGIPIDGSVFLDAQGSSEVGTPSVIRYVTRFTRKFGRRIGRAGSTPFGPDTRITDGNGNLAGAGVAGRFEVRGPTIFHGYWNDAALTARVIRDGWFFTGDIVRKGADGHFIQLDREVDVIHTAKGSVYSLPIEEIIHMHPAVYDTCVYGQTQDDGFSLPAAAVALRSGHDTTSDALLAELNSMLSDTHQLCSVDILTWSEFPIGVTGKTLKRVFRERVPAVC